MIAIGRFFGKLYTIFINTIYMIKLCIYGTGDTCGVEGGGGEITRL